MRARLPVAILISLVLATAFAGALLVGSGTVAASSCEPYRPYVVQRGDTLAGIAQQYGTTVPTLLDLNPDLSNQYTLYTSQVLCVPVDPDADAPLGSQVVLEVTYQYTPTDNVEAAWNLVKSRGGYIGKRLEFPLSTVGDLRVCLLYTSPSPRDRQKSRMPSSA
jgi:LysM repeat protein